MDDMTRRIHCTVLSALAFVLLALTSLAHGADSASRYYEDALGRYERADHAGAVIQLKNALQLDPALLPAYLLLGKALLRSGSPADAEVALLKAQRLGADRSELAVPLGQAYVDQGKFRTLLEQVSADALPPRVRAEVLVLRAHAHAELRELDRARQSLEQARISDPKSISARLGQADLLLREGDRVAAARLADEAALLAPDHPKVWHLKGSIAHVSNQVADALAGYGKAISLDPKFLEARVARASLLIDTHRDADAAADLEALRRDFPDDMRGSYLRAVWLSRSGDTQAAREALSAVSKGVDTLTRDQLARNPHLLLLGGLAHYGLNQQEKAKRYLDAFLKYQPDHLGARKLLGSALITAGDVNGGISALGPVLKTAPTDTQALTLLAAALMAQKDYSKAAKVLEQAIELDSGTPDLRTSLGFSLFGIGEEDLGLTHLERALQLDPGQARAGIALAVILLKRNEAKRSIEVIQSVLRREPANVLAINLLGVAKLAGGDKAGARAAYERALKVAPQFRPAALNLAKLDVAQGNLEVARGRLRAILVQEPKNTQAMYELARSYASAGDSREAILWLEKIRAHDRRSVGPISELVHRYVEQGETESALRIAKELSSDEPENLTALAAMGRAYLAADDAVNARSTFSRMTRLAGYDATWQYQIARAQASAGNPSDALYSLEKALAADPEHLPAQVLRADLALRGNDPVKAEQYARRILSKHPGRSDGYRILGDIALHRADHAGALAHYRNALVRDDSTENALAVFRVQMQSNNPSKAIEFIEAWSRGHPGDRQAQQALAEGYLRTGNLPRARAIYESLLNAGGEQAYILNNLAHILARQGERKALDYAERAQRLAPRDPAVNDTLGWMLTQRGETDRGLRYLREARLRDAENMDIRYHLAAALHKAGRRDEARRELEPTLQTDVQFDARQDAQQLLRELRN